MGIWVYQKHGEMKQNKTNDDDDKTLARLTNDVTHSFRVI